MKPSVWISAGRRGPGGAPRLTGGGASVAGAGGTGESWPTAAARCVTAAARSAPVRVLVLHARLRLALLAAAVAPDADRLLALVRPRHDPHREDALRQLLQRDPGDALAAPYEHLLAVHVGGHLGDAPLLRLADVEVELAPVDARLRGAGLPARRQRAGDRERPRGVVGDRLRVHVDRRVVHVVLEPDRRLARGRLG